jgi:hypothetical protein
MRTRVAAAFLVCLIVLFTTASAQAQYRPGRGLSDRATGETYNVEVGGFFWSPSPDIGISSESLPIVGQTATRIDFVNDLGIEKERFKQIKIVLRPAMKHKFRFEYTPISYSAEGTIRRDVIFNGIIFPVALPVQTDMT